MPTSENKRSVIIPPDEMSLAKAIAAHLHATLGVPDTVSSAVRAALRSYARELGLTGAKATKKKATRGT